jgi:protein-S-isoprenylcysteine O-methyltransferase Ste14
MIYVLIQFACILVLILNAQLKTFYYLDVLFFFLSISIGGRALYIMKVSNLNIMPDLKNNHKLRTEDIYCFVRHPMYSSVLLLCFALLLNNINILSTVVFIVLAVDLFLKALYEEGKLLAQFSEYEAYQKKTSMFFPFKFRK